jgi:hypothetical protein
MQHLEGSGTPVLYIGRTIPKVNVVRYPCQHILINFCILLDFSFLSDTIFQTDRCISYAEPTILYSNNTREIISSFDQIAIPVYFSKR